MKKFIQVFVLIGLSFFFNSCSTSVDNSITFKNLASNTVYVNFRAELITIAAGKTVIVKEIPKGKYTYSTTYQIPAGTTESRAEGAVSGELDIRAGTKVLIVYSSSFINGVYVLSATISYSDDQTGEQQPIAP
jgi:hypothetical protein